MFLLETRHPGLRQEEGHVVGGPGGNCGLLASPQSGFSSPVTELLSCGPAFHAVHGLHDPHSQRSQLTRKIGKQLPTSLSR